MANKLSLDVSQQYQTIDHFGASGAWSLDPIGKMWSEESKNQMADLLFSKEKGIGLSCWRFAIGSGGAGDHAGYPEPIQWRGHSDTFKKDANSPYDWSTHAGQRWFMEAAKARGVEHFIAMAYSPPIWLTKNGKIAPDELVGQSNLADDRMKEFVQYLADILQRFAEKEIPFDVISPVNEPSWSWDDSQQEGNRYTNDQIKSIVRALDEELQKRNLPTAIDIVEAAEIAALLDDEDVQAFNPQLTYYTGNDNTAKHGGKYREYVKDFLGDADFAPLIGLKLSYHSYWADHAAGEDRLQNYRELLRKALNRYAPTAKLWQTEYCNLNADGPGRDLGMGMALFTARVIHYDLAVSQVSSWSWWLAVSPHDYKDGLIFTDFVRRGDPETVLPSKTLWVLGQYSKFIRPGAVRVELSGTYDKEGILASAYAHHEDQMLSIVIINYGERDEEIIMESDTGIPDTMFGYITSDREGDDMRNFGSVRMDESLTIPGKSMITLHGSL